jgi:hypothetical protein
MARQHAIGELEEDTPTTLQVETVWLFDRSDPRWRQGVDP